ncbi:MAG: methylated-DNA--[protein]-cysteine S-methyltransferase [Caulobacterales bacterium]|nr:methylated-DNA--[protein]-cysteine S-methyltransferase [Caulobacterales bacterium]
MRRLLRRHWGEAELVEGRAPGAIRSAVEAWFGGDLTALDGLKVRTNGTDFQHAVWAALRAIPAGETRTYGQLAAAIGSPKAVRAAGLANGQNPIAVIVPCHRVIGADGALTGYAGGLERKRWLLAHEGARAA